MLKRLDARKGLQFNLNAAGISCWTQERVILTLSFSERMGYFGQGKFLQLPPKAPTPGLDLGDSGPFVLVVLTRKWIFTRLTLRDAARRAASLALRPGEQRLE